MTYDQLRIMKNRAREEEFKARREGRLTEAMALLTQWKMLELMLPAVYENETSK